MTAVKVIFSLYVVVFFYTFINDKFLLFEILYSDLLHLFFIFQQNVNEIGLDNFEKLRFCILSLF